MSTFSACGLRKTSVEDKEHMKEIALNEVKYFLKMARDKENNFYTQRMAKAHARVLISIRADREIEEVMSYYNEAKGYYTEMIEKADECKRISEGQYIYLCNTISNYVKQLESAVNCYKTFIEV